MELALDIIGERFTTLYQMSKPTYLSRDVFAPLEIFILLSVVSKFGSGLRGIFSSHTGQHEKLVPVSPVQSILCTYCQIIFV